MMIAPGFAIAITSMGKSEIKLYRKLIKNQKHRKINQIAGKNASEFIIQR
jgi:hypothetical protein